MFEQIDTRPTPIGQITLRRRRIPGLTQDDIYEVKLGDEFLMSSLFVKAEEALADLGLAALDEREADVVVGGLGLGYTAVAALKHHKVRSLLVVELLEPVIEWHQTEQVPLGAILNADPRNRYVQGSFFDLVNGEPVGFDPQQPGRVFDAILLDIDHSPSFLLNATNASFYQPESLGRMARQLRPNGVFALWSNEPPAADFVAMLDTVFSRVDAHIIRFYNPFQNNEATATVYVAVK
jgi:spermidine synthase